ncbi:hypothetical protein Naga_100448g5 [Nannochloropsis gaditana]|uniref:Uncharacterized protein n=1 Tax=Nannochloropsis gaditana TaxID=72520 RepID=W7THE5_9STRA|nr:hypothetical protein Naga_100448g5 [Nannochloropsis gaditana]
MRCKSESLDCVKRYLQDMKVSARPNACVRVCVQMEYLTGKGELILKYAHATKKARDSNTVQNQEQCDCRKLQYIVQHYDELQLPPEKKPDVINNAEFRVPAGNQSVRALELVFWVSCEYLSPETYLHLKVCSRAPSYKPLINFSHGTWRVGYLGRLPVKFAGGGGAYPNSHGKTMKNQAETRTVETDHFLTKTSPADQRVRYSRYT